MAQSSMCHSPLGKTVGSLVWLLTSLGAIHLGLIGLGINVWNLAFVQNNLSCLVQPAHWVIGVAGVISLVMLVSKLGQDCK